MSKYIRMGPILASVVLFISGCGTLSTYTLDREREDQEMTGNAGYLSGTPQKPDRTQYRKTRKTYVVEIQTKGPQEPQVEIPQVDTRIAPDLAARPATRQDSEKASPIRIPAIESISPESQAVGFPEGGFSEYTVQENDTLQKISKKFYDRYSRWQKIYDANKDVIKDPNHIKPGTTLKIPREE